MLLNTVEQTVDTTVQMEVLKSGEKHCECGCGEAIAVMDKHKRPRRFKKSHHVRVYKTSGRKSLKIFMTLKAARDIAGALGHARKMPGWGYGLDAFKCIKGSELAKDPTSTCADCFARRDLYLWRGVRAAHSFRMQAIEHPLWIQAMVELINHHCQDEPWFRWHDSGDLMSVEHLGRICDIVSQTPSVTHWLPTREYDFVSEYLKNGGTIPENLTVRLSAYYVGKKPNMRKHPLLKVLPTSTVHEGHGTTVRIDSSRKTSIECKAYTRGNRCHTCRACWSPKVKNISYPIH